MDSATWATTQHDGGWEIEFAKSQNMEAENFKKLKNGGLKHTSSQALRFPTHSTTIRATLNLCFLCILNNIYTFFYSVKKFCIKFFSQKVGLPIDTPCTNVAPPLNPPLPSSSSVASFSSTFKVTSANWAQTLLSSWSLSSTPPNTCQWN